MVQSLPLVNYAEIYWKWLSAMVHQQQYIAMCYSAVMQTPAKNSIWSPAQDAERTNASLPSDAMRCHGDQPTPPGFRHAVMRSSPETEIVVRQLLDMSGDKQRSWNELAAISMYDTLHDSRHLLPLQVVVVVVIIVVVFRRYSEIWIKHCAVYDI